MSINNFSISHLDKFSKTKGKKILFSRKPKFKGEVIFKGYGDWFDGVKNDQRNN